MSRSSRFDAATVQEAINTCEQKHGVYANRSKLFEAVAEGLATTTSTIAGTFDREKMTCKTPLGKKGMGGGKLEVDPKELQAEIDRQESSQTFRTQTLLFEAVAASEYGQSIGLTAAVAYNRVKEFGLTTKTEPARHFKPKATQEERGEKGGDSSNGESPGTARTSPQTAPDRPASPRGIPDPSTDYERPKGRWGTSDWDIDLDYFLRHFIGAGFRPGDIRDIGDMVTSADKTDAENERIRQAWSAVRRLVGPAPGKVGGSLAG